LQHWRAGIRDKVQVEAPLLATRQSSQAALNALGPALPELVGGSADLTPSNGTLRKDSTRPHRLAAGGELCALRRA
jgi:transketolase